MSETKTTEFAINEAELHDPDDCQCYECKEYFTTPLDIFEAYHDEITGPPNLMAEHMHHERFCEVCTDSLLSERD